MRNTEQQIENYITTALETCFSHKNYGSLLYGSFARKELREESDIDLLVISKEKISLEEIRRLSDLQKKFKEIFNRDLSVDINEDKDYRMSLTTGHGLLKFLAIRRDIKNPSILDHYTPPIKQHTIALFLLDRSIEIKRMFLFNLINQNPTGRIFKNTTPKPEDMDIYVVESFMSMVKHLVGYLNMPEIHILTTNMKADIGKIYKQIPKKYTETKAQSIICLLDTIIASITKLVA